MNNVLIISPHSDDAELGCGGFISKLVSLNKTVSVLLVLAKNERMIHSSGQVTQWNTRVNEFDASMDSLGVIKANRFYGYFGKDIGFDLCALPKGEVVSYFDSVIKNTQAEVVLLPCPSFHQEHKYVYECGIAATRPTKYDSQVRTVALYEYPASNWGDSAGLNPAMGGVYVDISNHMDEKIKALRCHESQMYREEASLISIEGVEALARMRGLESGFQYAELLYLLRDKW